MPRHPLLRVEGKPFHLYKFRDVKTQGIQALQHAKEIMDGLNIRWWLSTGTALGLYTDKDFIPPDTDIDISILVRRNDPMNIVIYNTLLQKFSSFTPIRTMYIEGLHTPVQLALQNNEGIILDFYFTYDGYHEGYYTFWNDSGYCLKPKHLINNVTLLPTKYGDYPMPSPIEEYLEVRFGKGWKVPKTGKENWRDKDSINKEYMRL